MALGRVWIPSPNYSSSRSRNQLLVVHTSEGATTFRNLGNFLAQQSAQVSYQVGFDDTSSTEIGEYVKPHNKAWSAMNANDWGEHGCLCTPSGASAGWSRDVWLSHANMLAACAAWLAEESVRYGIPLVKVDAAGINAGAKGVCGHGDVSAAGAGGSHFDPGNNFPWDVVLGQTTGEPDVTVDEMIQVLRNEGVSGAGDGGQPWCQVSVRDVVRDTVLSLLRAEGVSGAGDGGQPWCQVSVRDVVREEVAKALGKPPARR